MDYRRLLEKGESEEIEFKASFDKEAIVKTVSAMANKNGGFIFVGVSDDGKVKGYSGKDPLKKIADTIASSIEPSIAVGVKETEIDGKKVLVIEVQPAPIKPVSAHGRYYIRVGSTDRLMGISEICDLYSLSTSRSWDTQTIGEANLSDIDLSFVARFMGRLRLRSERYEEDDPELFLKKKRLLKEGRVTAAALLLFGKDPQSFFPYAVVQITCRGESKADIRFQEDIRGRVTEMIEEAVGETLKLIATKLEIEGVTSVQGYAVPREALREGIINALAHRDWSVPSPVNIEISPKGVRIVNPGVIPPPLTPEALKEPDHYSVLRNPKICEMLYEAGYIERYGSGTLRIIEAYREAGAQPDWGVRMGRTILFLPFVREENLEIAVMRVVSTLGKAKVEDITSRLGISANTARKYLRLLLEKGLVEARGKTKGRHYVPKKEPENSP